MVLHDMYKCQHNANVNNIMTEDIKIQITFPDYLETQTPYGYIQPTD